MTVFPKLLILSNDCLSQSTSNGRTLDNFLLGWPKEKLAQFCVRNSAPDFMVCDQYYYVSDRAALGAFVKGIPAGEKLHIGENVEETIQKPVARKKRNAITMLIRDMVWNSMRWAGKEFYMWVEEFHPEIILLQAGDCGFMLRLARHLAARYQIPLVIYNSEAYYFKNYDYFRSKGIAKLAYPLFRRLYCREFEKTIRMAAFSVYCCEKLKRDYDSVFGRPSEVIHTATRLCGVQTDKENTPIRISYLGNLGIGRHEGLIAIGEALQKISLDLKLDVYGCIPNEMVEEAFASCAGIRYRGFVNYDEVIKIMTESDILIHTESFDPFYVEDLKYGFSTKVADCLAIGRCFLVYAPEQMACTEYLKTHDAAFVVTQQEQILPVLETLCRKPEARNRYVDLARRLAESNHNPERNACRFREIIYESVRNAL